MQPVGLIVSIPANNPNHVYSGLLTVLMRLVFVMYAEGRDLLSSDPVYSNYYSVTGLFNRLREDAGRHPDTMNQRFGAWSQLITLFRLVYEGGQHGDFKLPARKGYLFDPERYPFLEGRVVSGEWSVVTGDGTDQAPFTERPNQPNVGRTSQITSAKSGEGRVTSGVKNPPLTTLHPRFPASATALFTTSSETSSSWTANGSATGRSMLNRSAPSTKRSWASMNTSNSHCQSQLLSSNPP